MKEEDKHTIAIQEKQSRQWRQANKNIISKARGGQGFRQKGVVTSPATPRSKKQRCEDCCLEMGGPWWDLCEARIGKETEGWRRGWPGGESRWGILPRSWLGRKHEAAGMEGDAGPCCLPLPVCLLLRAETRKNFQSHREMDEKTGQFWKCSWLSVSKISASANLTHQR